MWFPKEVGMLMSCVTFHWCDKYYYLQVVGGKDMALNNALNNAKRVCPCGPFTNVLEEKRPVGVLCFWSRPPLHQYSPEEPKNIASCHSETIYKSVYESSSSNQVADSRAIPFLTTSLQPHCYTSTKLLILPVRFVPHGTALRSTCMQTLSRQSKN